MARATTRASMASMAVMATVVAVTMVTTVTLLLVMVEKVQARTLFPLNARNAQNSNTFKTLNNLHATDHPTTSKNTTTKHTENHNNNNKGARAPTTRIVTFSKSYLLFDETLHLEPPWRFEFRVQSPRYAGAILTPQELWESYAVYAYNTVIQDPTNPAVVRLYYDCIDAVQNRYMCLATSTDYGVTFQRTFVNLYSYQGSFQNNIVWPRGDINYQYYEPGVVFYDTNPNASPNEKWKMFATTNSSVFVHGSSDGLVFHQLYSHRSVYMSDTMNIAWWDSNVNMYRVYLRHDDFSTGFIRSIAVCLTPTLSNFESQGSRRIIFSADQQDPPNMDVYTNAANLYQGYFLFFPSMFSKFYGNTPENCPSDGLLDIRFVYSLDGVNLQYSTLSSNARHPIMSLGVNRCRFRGFFNQSGGWCDVFEMASTSPFTSSMYWTAGHVISQNQEEVYFYVAGQPFSHGFCSPLCTWGTNIQIARLAFRTDGFVAAEAPYTFSGIGTDYPTLTLGYFDVPPCVSWTDHVEMQLNARTSSVGWILVELFAKDNTTDTSQFSSLENNFIRGNFIWRTVSWGGQGHLNPYTQDLTPIVGYEFGVRIYATDAQLYSLRFVCVPDS